MSNPLIQKLLSTPTGRFLSKHIVERAGQVFGYPAAYVHNELADQTIGQKLQEAYHNTFDPEGRNATQIGEMRARAQAMAFPLYMAGMPYVPEIEGIPTPSVPRRDNPIGNFFGVPSAKSQMFGLGFDQILGRNHPMSMEPETRSVLNNLDLANETERLRYERAVASHNQLDAITFLQNKELFESLDKYRSEYRRKYGIMPSQKLVSAKIKEIRSRHVNPADFFRGQFLPDQSNLQQNARLYGPTIKEGKGRTSLHPNDIIYKELGRDLVTPAGMDVRGGTLYLPYLDRIKPYRNLK